MTYFVATAKEAKELEFIVNEWIDKGYQPHGSISVTEKRGMRYDHPTMVYTQAMVKK